MKEERSEPTMSILPGKVSDFLKIAVAAAGRGDLQTVQAALAEKPAWIRRVGSHGRTMLWEAAYRGRLAMVDYLLDRGADIHACGCHFTPLLVEISPYCAARYKRHDAVADRLLRGGRAYRCYCSAERLERVRAAHNGYDRRCRNLSAAEHAAPERVAARSVVRFKVPLQGATRYEDLLLGPIERANADLNPDPVLLKSDGFPTYHLAAIADDHAMRISHVLRSQEWVSSAPLHLLIFAACGWQPPHYAHLPAVNGPDGKKLAKRHGATGLGEFRRRGFLPAALVNYLALLGWSPGDDRELFRLPELDALLSFISTLELFWTS